MEKDAYLYDKLDGNKVKCFLCNHQCLIKDGKRGICGVRENQRGTLISLVYGKVISGNVDPIEKKPLFHFLPGSRSYSIATVGCNFKCRFCQNSDISQMPADHNRILGENLSPEYIVENAVSKKSATIAYTYTEPTIYYELAKDTARRAVEKGVSNVFVSNGYMTEECLQDIAPDLHGANVDLKGFSDRFYKEQCGAKIEPVLRTIEAMVKSGIWLEVTTLLIPGLNDSIDELKELAGFLASVDKGIAWHISRFHPTYRMTDRDSTQPQIIQRARDIGFEAGLQYVYSGNLPGDKGESTYCHECGELLIKRFGFNVMENRITAGRCPDCDAVIPGVWA